MKVMDLPMEMRVKIWSYLDFKTLQKTCTLVCKTWFEEVRGDGRLSGQLSLKNDEIEEEEVKTILSQWEKIKILRLSKSLDHLDLSITHKFLTKVIIPNFWYIPGYNMDMVATKIWFNPHNIVPQLGPDNVIELKLQLRLHDVTPFHSMNLKNLERLHINWDHVFPSYSDVVDFKVRIEPIFQGFTDSPNLHEVVLCRQDCFWVHKTNIIVSNLIRKYLPHSKLKIIQ